jgi:tRNA A37 methylthiotransferase MiaB
MSDGQIKGRNFAYKSVLVARPIKIGQKAQIEITDVTTHSLIGAIAS